MLVSPALAQASGGSGFGLVNMVPLILIFVIMYFLLIRPQQKKAKQHREMVANLNRGDMVVTQGGIIGQITRVKSEGEVVVEISEGVRIRVVRGTISQILPREDTGDD